MRLKMIKKLLLQTLKKYYLETDIYLYIINLYTQLNIIFLLI